MTDEEIRKRMNIDSDKPISDLDKFIAIAEDQWEREGQYLKWEPYVHYSTHGDFFQAVYLPNGYYAKWHGCYLSTLHDHETHEMVGVDIFGLSEVMNSAFSLGRDENFRVFYNRDMDSIEVTFGKDLGDVNYVDDVGGGVFLHGGSNGIIMVEIINITRHLREEAARMEKYK